MASRKDRMALHNWDGVTVMDLGAMDIWDGADLSLLRETLAELIDVEQRKRIGVDMRHVKYIPSGFFGMLYDCYEHGVDVYLYAPQENVARMLWFRQFFHHVEGEAYILRELPAEEFTPVLHEAWKHGPPWDGEENTSESITAGSRSSGN